MKAKVEQRNAAKKKKPKFLRQDGHKKVKLSNSWRKPKGRHSKMRLKLASYRKQPSMGYSSPKEVRGFNRQGLKEVMINNVKELANLKDEVAVIISSTVGARKRLAILKKIKDMKHLVVSNIKDTDAYMKEVEEKFKEKKKESKERETEKKKSKEEALKKAEDKKKEEEKKSEEQKEEEKEVQDKKVAKEKATQQPVKQ